ncbi:MAG: response regulator transcription factor [Acidimicrobiales bacterium]|nr:response regulator transcription factor [Acidimicrobiales bacterium]
MGAPTIAGRILVVEDDERLADLVRRYLERDGHHVLVAHDGRRGLELARHNRPDVIVLDLMLPGLDGWDICRILRAESDVPIMMVTARTTEDDTLLGLDLGADDYLAKPFSPRELVARVRVLLRRTGVRVDDEVLEVGDLVVDRRRHEARLGGRVLELTPKEFALLEALAGDPGRAFRRADLWTALVGWDADRAPRTLDVHVLNLRRKLGDEPADPRYIETVAGVGYRLVAP